MADSIIRYPVIRYPDMVNPNTFESCKSFKENDLLNFYDPNKVIEKICSRSNFHKENKEFKTLKTLISFRSLAIVFLEEKFL